MKKGRKGGRRRKHQNRLTNYASFLPTYQTADKDPRHLFPARHWDRINLRNEKGKGKRNKYDSNCGIRLAQEPKCRSSSLPMVDASVPGVSAARKKMRREEKKKRKKEIKKAVRCAVSSHSTSHVGRLIVAAFCHLVWLTTPTSTKPLATTAASHFLPFPPRNTKSQLLENLLAARRRLLSILAH